MKYIVADDNLSRLINTFRFAKGFKWTFSIYDAVVVINFSYKNVRFFITINEEGCFENVINVYKKMLIDTSSSIQLTPSPSKTLDLIGLLKAYKFICVEINFRPELSNDTRVEFEFKEEDSYVEPQEVLKKKKRGKLKPYHKAFLNEGFKDFKTQNKIRIFDIVNTYCVKRELEKTIIYSYYVSIEGRKETVDHGISKDNLTKGYRQLTKDLHNHLKLKRLVSLRRCTIMLPNDAIFKDLFKKEKKSFSNPRIQNKQNIRKHIEEFNNSKEFYKIIKTL